MPAFSPGQVQSVPCRAFVELSTRFPAFGKKAAARRPFEHARKHARRTSGSLSAAVFYGRHASEQLLVRGQSAGAAMLWLMRTPSTSTLFAPMRSATTCGVQTIPAALS